MKTPALTLASLLSTLAAAAGNPLGIDGLRLWLDASDAATINTTGGGLVTQWNDKSGFNNHAVQGNPDRQPTVGTGVLAGQNAIRLDAPLLGAFATDPTADGMLINPGSGPGDPAAFTINRAYTVFLVDQYWGAQQNRTLTNVDGTSNWLLGHWNGNQSHYTGDFVGPNTPTGVNVPLISEAVGTATASYVTRNLTSPRYAGSQTANPGRVGFGDDDAIVWSEPSQADIGDMIAFNRALTDTERWQVHDYLRAKYDQPFRLSQAHATRSTVFNGGDNGEGLDFQGDFVAAVNAGGPGGFNIGDAAFTSDTGVTAEYNIPAWQSTTFGGATPTAEDGNLRTVMDSIRWSAFDNTGVDDVSVSLPGLTVGNTYKVQILFGEAGGGSTRHHAVEIEGRTQINDYLEGAYRGTDNPTALGSAVIHEFVATDTTLEFRLHSTGLGGGDLNQLLNGFTVENRGITGITTTGTFGTAGDLDLSGTFDYAVAVGGSGGQTVGSAAFTDDNVAGVQLGAEHVIPGWLGPVDFTGSPEDMALGNAMNSIRYSTTDGMQDGLSVDIAVTPGQEYKLQLLFMEGCCDRGFDVSLEGVLTLTDFSPNALGANAGNETGAVITHTFTAGDDTLNVMLDGFATGFADRNPTLNAFTLERIPEPGAASLGLLAGAFLLRRRRRSRD